MTVAAVARSKFEELSISQIAERCDLDRATTKKRLEHHGYKPISVKAKLKLYRFDVVMKAKLTAKADVLTDIRARKETAAAEKIEIEVATKRGELVPAAEFLDVVQRLFGGQYKEQIRIFKRLAPRLAKMKSAPDIERLLLTEYQKFSNSLRADFKKFVPMNGNGKR